MAITDELRKLFDRYTMRRDIYDELLAIADRIDAEHERALSHAYMDVSDSMWLRLPKDIDDKPIDEHDKVDWRDHAGTWHENVTVVAVCHDGCYVMDGTVFHVHKSDIRHHHASTVEEVLYDSLKHFGAVDERTPEVDSWVCEQAAKLREMLAGDAE